MCSTTITNYSLKNLDLKNKRILEVGAYNINGSIRNLFNKDANEWIGTDILQGPGVDKVISAENLISKFKEESFDVVICTEMLEHAEHWQECIYNMKGILKVGGIIFLTTVTNAFSKHNEPDYWRFTPETIKQMFSDFEIIKTKDGESCGALYVIAKKINSIYTKPNFEVEHI